MTPANPSPSLADPACTISAVPAFQDNYLWILAKGGQAAVVDPGDAQPVLEHLRQHRLELAGILLTHHHGDHVGGVPALCDAYPGVAVIGPANSPIAGITQPRRHGDTLAMLGEQAQVIGVPGHTLDHIAYWFEGLDALFCGDTLFAGGCGRVFEGTPAQLHESLGRLNALPGHTRVFCAHEYTLSNLRFASVVEPGNQALAQRLIASQALRAQGQATVPSLLSLERATNPFLRCGEASVRAAVADRLVPPGDEAAVFAALRAWKNTF